MRRIINFPHWYFLFAVIVTVVLLRESYTYPGYWSRFVGFALFAPTIALGVTVILLLWIFAHRWRRRHTNLQSLTDFKQTYFLLSWSAIAGVLGALSFVFELIYHPNFTLSVLGFHPEVFVWVAVTAWVIFVVAALSRFLALPQQPVTNHDKWFFWPLPLSSFLPFTIFSLLSPNWFEIFGQEDHLVEWLTVVALLWLALNAGHWRLRLAKTAVNIWKKRLLLLLLVGSLIIAGEEISWGQRIFDITTPAELAEINVQGETTLHNIQLVQDKMFYAYLLLGFIGSFGWLVAAPLRRRHRLPALPRAIINLLPSQVFSAYSLPLLTYSVVRIFVGPVYYKTWEEYVELLFFFGYALFLYWQQRSKRA